MDDEDKMVRVWEAIRDAVAAREASDRAERRVTKVRLEVGDELWHQALERIGFERRTS